LRDRLRFAWMSSEGGRVTRVALPRDTTDAKATNKFKAGLQKRDEEQRRLAELLEVDSFAGADDIIRIDGASSSGP
jgi:hypothetical protein